MAANFPNSTDHLFFLYTGAATTPMTVMCWSYLNVSGPAANRWFISGEHNWNIGTSTDGQTFEVGEYGTGPFNSFNGPALSSGAWYHTACSINPLTTSSINSFGYVNGTRVVSVNNTSNTFVTYSQITFGNDIGSGTYSSPLYGALRDVRIWTRILTDKEIANEMHSAIPLSKTGLLGWWPLDTDLTNDKSGNGHILTTTSGVTLQSGPLQPYVKSNSMRWT